MKYRLPGIYLGNISMDLFMEYVKLNDLSDLGSFNEYFKVDNRTKNRSAHKVKFTISETDYNFITYDIYQDKSIYDFISVYFADVLGATDPVTDPTSIDYTIEKDIPISNLFFYDALHIPSIYGTYVNVYGGNPRYMIEVNFRKKVEEGEEELPYQVGYENLRDALHTDEDAWFEVILKDQRLATDSNTTIYYAHTDGTWQSQIALYTTTNFGTGYGDITIGRRTMMNEITPDNTFIYRNNIGQKTVTKNKNTIWKDIIDNRKIFGRSIEAEILKTANNKKFKGVAGIINKLDSVTVAESNFRLVKYDQYYIEKKYTKVTSITDLNIPIVVEDMNPYVVNEIEKGLESNIYIKRTGDDIIKYSTILNTENLPMVDAIYNNDKFYVYKTIRGDIPITDGTLTLINPKELKAKIRRPNNNARFYDVNYSVKDVNGKNYIHRTVTIGGNTYFIRMSVDEESLSASIIIPSKPYTGTLSTKTKIKSVFSENLSGLGIITLLDDLDDMIIPSSYSYDTTTEELNPSSWFIRFDMPKNEVTNLDILYAADLEPEFTDVVIPSGEKVAYIEYPVDIQLLNRTSDGAILTTAKFGDILTSNLYSNTNTYYYNVENDDVEKPILDEYYLDEYKPYNNIEEFINRNGFESSDDYYYYTKEYYLVNEFDQNFMYHVEERLKIDHQGDVNEPPNFDNVFGNIVLYNTDLIKNTLYNISKESKGLSPQNRGRVVPSDILGSNLINTLRNDIINSFNTLFYNFSREDNKAEIDIDALILEDNMKPKEVESRLQAQTDFIKTVLVDYKSFSKTLSKFLEYSFRPINDSWYTIDDRFRLGFYTFVPETISMSSSRFVDWIESSKNNININKYNTLERIRLYEEYSSENVSDQLIKEDIMENRTTKTVGKDFSFIPVLPQGKQKINVNNLDLIRQGFEMIMDDRYKSYDVIVSFENLDINKTIIKDDKFKEKFSGSHKNYRYVNTNQSIDTMIKNYMNGFTGKVGD